VSNNLEFYLTKYNFADQGRPDDIVELATWYDPGTSTAFFVDDLDTTNGTTIIAVQGVTPEGMVNVFA